MFLDSSPYASPRRGSEFQAAARYARWPGVLLGVALLYFLAAKLGIATKLPPEGIVAVWPPNAIVVAALLSVDRRQWWQLLLVTVATEVVADVPDYPLWSALGYGIVNFGEAALTASLLSSFGRPSLPLRTRQDFVVFVICGPLAASGCAALFGAAIYRLGAADVDYLHYWRVFWLGDALGLLVFGTILLSWRRPPLWRGRAASRAAGEAVLLALGLIAATAWALLSEPDIPRVYLIFPFLLWAALRFGIHGASLAVLATTAAAIASAIQGVGPLTSLSNVETVLSVQGMIAVVALSTFMLAFSVEDLHQATSELAQEVRHRRAAYETLERVNKGLDEIVARRTEELVRSVARNELLFRELQHRIKNNLHLISALLGLHSRSVVDPVATSKFNELQSQIAAIAATYDLLHQTQATDTVDLCAIVPVLCRTIAGSHGTRVSLSFEGDGEAPVPADTAVALSLALNELITNSVKHGTGDGPVAITVGCRRDGKHIVLQVADSGAGFPRGFDLKDAKGFGTKMVLGLVAQTRGEIRLPDTEHGAIVEIRVPAAEPDRDGREPDVARPAGGA